MARYLALLTISLAITVIYLSPTEGTRTEEGYTCKFPFLYRGVTYNACSRVASVYLWCYTGTSTDPDTQEAEIDTGGDKYGACLEYYRTPNGHLCTFPNLIKDPENQDLAIETFGCYRSTTGSSTLRCPTISYQASHDDSGSTETYEGVRPDDFDDTCIPKQTDGALYSKLTDTCLKYVPFYYETSLDSLNTQGSGVTYQDSEKKHPECFNYCQTNNNCSAIDVVVTENSASNYKCKITRRKLSYARIFNDTLTTHYQALPQLDSYCVPPTLPPTRNINKCWRYQRTARAFGFKTSDEFDVGSKNPLNECANRCDTTLTCQGFDFEYDVISNVYTCHTFREHHSASELTTYSRSDHYEGIEVVNCTETNAVPVRTSATCISYKAHPQMLASGGYNLTRPMTMEGCEDVCRANVSCVGFNYIYTNSSNNHCYWFDQEPVIHYAPAGIHAVYFSVKIVTCTPPPEVEKPRISSDCVDYTIHTGKLGQGLRAQVASARTIQSCHDACKANENCKALSMDVSRGDTLIDCYMHLDRSYLVIDQPLGSPWRFDVVVICQGQPRTPEQCVEYVITFNTGFKRSGAVGFLSYSLAQCKENCKNNTLCQGFDYRKAERQCFIYNDLRFLASANQVAGTDHYRVKVITCPPAAPLTGTQHIKNRSNMTCIEYELLPNEISAGGILIRGNSLSACQKSCKDDTSCIAFDITKTSQPSCYIHKEGSILSSISNSNFDQYYVKIVQCQGSCIPGQYSNLFINQTSSATGRNTTEIDEQRCRSLCNSDASCEGYSYSNSTQVCKIHNKAKDLWDRKADSGGVVRVKLNCQTPCVDKFFKINNTQSVNGVGQANANSVQGCTSKCLEKSDCRGFDFDPSNANSACYLHMSEEFKINRVTKEGISQYERTNCSANVDSKFASPTTTTQTPSTTAKPIFDSEGCLIQYTIEESKGYYGATGLPVTNSSGNCRTRCATDSGCVGFDFKISSSTCFFHTSKPDRSYSSTDNIFYRKKPCAGPTTLPNSGGEVTPCTDTYTPHENRGSYGGVLLGTGQMTAEECMKLCNSEPACLAFDYDHEEQSCFSHSNQAYSQSINQNNDSPGVTQYVRVPCNSGGGPSPATNSVPGVSSGISGAPCVDSFDSYADKHRQGGTATAAGRNSLQDCEKACRDDSNCLAFDYNPSDATKCYIFQQLDPEMRDFVGNTHYVRKRCSSSGSDATCQMTSQSSMSSSGGEVINDSSGTALQMEAASCSLQCLHDAGCNAADFDYNARLCYKHTVSSGASANNCCQRFTKSCPVATATTAFPQAG